MPKAISSNPRASSERPDVRSPAATKPLAARSAAAPSGTLIQNSHRQDACSMSRPPTPGPRAGPRATAKPTVPISRPSCLLPAAAAMIVWPAGTIRPAASPCRPRARVSVARSVARAQQTDARMKIVRLAAHSLP